MQKFPILPDFESDILLPDENGCWREFSDLRIGGLWAGDILPGQEIMDAGIVRGGGHFTTSQQRLNFRPEDDSRSILRIEKRLHPQPVPCEQKLARAPVPDC